MKRLPPGPTDGGWLGWRFGRRFQTDMLGFIEELARDHTELAYFRTGPIENVVITSPALAHEALALRAREFPKHARALGLLERLDGRAITVEQGEPWRRQRRLVQPAFNPARLGGYAETVVACARAAVARWDGPVEMAQEMTVLALDVITRALFGADLNGQAPRLGRAIQDFAEVLRFEVGSPLLLPDWLPLPAKRRKRRAIAVVHDFVEGVIRRRRADPVGRDDLLAMLLQAADDEAGGARLSDRQVRDEAVALFRGGFDTTAAGLTWALHLLSTHPDVADAARAEADAVLGDRPATLADLPRLRYTAMVVKESLRLYPPIWSLFGRWAPVETELGGWRIPRGAWLHVFPWALHRCERLFREPLRFDPERLAPERAGEVVPYSYIPFGVGPHICIGKEFASMQMVLTIATVLQQVRLAVPAGRGAVAPEPDIAVRPKGGLPLVAERRSAVSCSPLPAGERGRG